MRARWTRALGLWMVLAAGVLGPASVRAADEPTVGIVKTVQGTASIVRQGQPLAAQPGLAVLEGDTLRTGTDGTLGVILRDDSRLTLGPASEITIENFSFAPAEGKLGLLMRMARGVGSYISGAIARLAPGSVRVQTPVAVAAVRGTHVAISVQGAGTP